MHSAKLVEPIQSHISSSAPFSSTLGPGENEMAALASAGGRILERRGATKTYN